MEAAAAHVLHLLDLYWFRQQILLPPPPTPADPQPPPPLILRRHRRTLSHESAPAPSASLAIQPPQLSTILSEKEAPPEALFPAPPAAGAAHAKGNGDRRQKRRRLRRKKSKSLTDLEFEELKGLIDLGFAFSDEEAADPRLLEIVPGLRRNKAGDAPASVTVARPYLSEAWETRPDADLLNNWRFQAASSGRADLKDQLRSWAHAVASTVVR